MLQAAIDRLEGRDHVTEFKGPLAAIDPLKALDGAGEVGAGERGDETTVESKETGPMGKNKKEWTEEQRARHSALMKEVGARRVARKKAAVEGREPAPEKCQAAAPVVMSNGFATPAGTQEPASVSLQEGLTVVRLLRRMSAFERATILELVEGR
jgi:hypothetical protein